MLRTLKIKLHPTPEQHTVLLETMERFNAACDWIAVQAHGGRVTNKVAMQKLVYYAVREQFGLSAQLTIRAIAKVAEAYKRDPKIVPRFKPHGAIVYDERILSFAGLELASIWTLQGRIQVAITVCVYHQGIIGNSHVRGQADLCFVRGAWYLLLVVNTPDESCQSPDDVLGVDLGIVNLATDSDGNVYSGATVERQRRIYAHRRRNLQKKRTRAAKRKLKALSGKQRRFQSNINHVVSKRIVANAKGTGRSIALEDLTGIRDRTTVKRKQRARHANWAFYQLRQFISYKATLNGVAVVLVDPRNTSRQCQVCGHIAKENRSSQSKFLCVQCGFAAPADHNAARNIRARAAVMLPLVASPTSAMSGGGQLQATLL